MTTLSKAIYKFNAIPIKSLTAFIFFLKWKICPSNSYGQGATNSQNNLEKKDKFGGYTLPYFKTYYKTTVIKAVVMA